MVIMGWRLGWWDGREWVELMSVILGKDETSQTQLSFEIAAQSILPSCLARQATSRTRSPTLRSTEES